MARVEYVADALYWHVAGHERARDLTHMHLGTHTPANQRDAALDLIDELDGIGAAIAAIIATDERGMSNRHAEALALVERLRGVASDLEDDVGLCTAGREEPQRSTTPAESIAETCQP